MPCGPSRPRCRPDKLHTDQGYDYRRGRAYLTWRGTKIRIGLGRVRGVVERTISWLPHPPTHKASSVETTS